MMIECPYCGERITSNDEVIELPDNTYAHVECLIEQIKDNAFRFDETNTDLED